MHGKSFNFFYPSTTKLLLFKTFTKLNKNQLLMNNISKPRKYQRFGLMKMHNTNKILFVN